MIHPRSSLCVTVAVTLLAVGAALAQSVPPTVTPPPKLEPLPEIPPPPGVTGDADLEPQVTIKQRGGDVVEEARINGRLVWIKVTPPHGRPYYLVPDGTGNVFIRRDSLDSGLKVPLWVLLEF